MVDLIALTNAASTGHFTHTDGMSGSGETITHGDDHEVNHISQEMLHLKSFCSMCGENTIAMGGNLGFALAHWMHTPTDNNIVKHVVPQEKNNREYDFVHVPDIPAANCIFVNGTLIRRSHCEYPLSDAIFNARVPKEIPQITVVAGELEKVDGCLTCTSVLF
jgi:dimethylargininase